MDTRNKEIHNQTLAPFLSAADEYADDGGASDEHSWQQLRPPLRRKVDDSGHALSEMRSQIVWLRAHAEIQAANIQGVEHEQVMRQELLQANTQNAELNDALLRAKDAVIESKTLLLQAKDAEIRNLQAEIRCCRAEAAVGGCVQPALAWAADAAAYFAPATAPIPAPAPAPAPAGAVAASAPVAPNVLFPLMDPKGQIVSDAVLSPDRLTITRRTAHGCAWACSNRGVGAGYGVVRWAVQLSKEGGFMSFMVGVASEAFRENTVIYPKHAWFMRNDSMIADQRQQGDLFYPHPFTAGDVVIVELERAHGVDGKLRVRVAGKTPREMVGLPMNGMLYPILGLSHYLQSATMVALNNFACLEL
jgi:hypothetical protein